MRQPGRLAIAMAAALLLVLGLGACGDDSDSSSTASPPAAGQPEPGEGSGSGEPSGGRPAPEARHGRSGGEEPTASHHDSGGGTAQFVVPGGDNSVQEFGSEADDSELEEAAAALHAFLDARAGGEWAKACEYLSADVAGSLARSAAQANGPGGGDCAELQAALSGPDTEEARAEAAIADVGALRVEGGRGFLLYHGAAETAYAIPMSREDGRWKVAALAGVPIS